MIQSITIKNIATFDAAGVEVSDLKKVNFFFGFNGTGKSTIARYLQNISLPQDKQSNDFYTCEQIGFDSTLYQILTFNEEFIDDNFRKSTTQKGIFSLNQKNDEIDKQIEKENNAKKQCDSYKKSIEKRKQEIVNDKQRKENDLKEFCWRQRQTFSGFVKIRLEYSGNKDSNLQKIRNILQNNLDNALTLEQLSEQYQNLYEKEISKTEKTIDETAYRQIKEIETQLETLLQEVIIGNEDVDIAKLINTLNIRSWVEKGVEFIEQTNGTCPFCQKQTIDDSLKDQFKKYFDETYKQKINQIQALYSQYQQQTNIFLLSILEIQNEFNPNNIVSEEHRLLKSIFDGNIEIIRQKIQNSNEKKSIVSVNTHKDQLDTIVSKVKENNETFEALDNNKNLLKQNIWKYMAFNCREQIDILEKRNVKYNKIETLASTLLDKYSSEIITIQQTIEQLRSQTINTKDAVEGINIILKNTGFDGFEIKEIENNENNISQYYLHRPGKPNEKNIFKKLSEGEKNFISFLYFYQLCIGTDDIQNNSAKKKIIIIDDPVSSLDSQSLFIVSTLIHNLILQKGNDNKPNKQAFKNDNIEQVFIFTHNFYFHKEISLNRRPLCTDYRHYLITKNNNKTAIVDNKERTVFDDYSLLWQTIKDLKENIPQNNSSNILISNAMRRIIDSYVNFIGYGRDTWGAVVPENQNDPSYFIKCAFISTINDDSHKITALDTTYYQKITNIQPQNLFDVFKEIFEKIGKEHYNMMMGNDE
jgi:wobble nucleotide-excising tRNase